MTDLFNWHKQKTNKICTYTYLFQNNTVEERTEAWGAETKQD